MPVSVDEMNGPDPIDLAFEKSGVTPEKLVKRLWHKFMYARVTKHFAFQGHVGDSRTLIDHNTQLKASQQLIDLSGWKKERHEHTGQGGGPIVVEARPMNLKGLNQAIKRSKDNGKKNKKGK